MQPVKGGIPFLFPAWEIMLLVIFEERFGGQAAFPVRETTMPPESEVYLQKPQTWRMIKKGKLEWQKAVPWVRRNQHIRL